MMIVIFKKLLYDYKQNVYFYSSENVIIQFEFKLWGLSDHNFWSAATPFI